MRSNRIVVASIAAALTLGTMCFVPASAQDTTPTTSVPMVVSTSHTLVCTSDPDMSEIVDGPVTIGLDADVTAAPEADEGASVDWSADYTLVLSDGLIAAAEQAALQDIDISDLHLVTHPNGGISGPDVAAAPSDFTIDVSAGSITVSASGTVTVDDALTTGLLSLLDPVSFSISLDLEQPFQVAVSCTSGNVDVAAINLNQSVVDLTLPPPPDDVIPSNPRYAG